MQMVVYRVSHQERLEALWENEKYFQNIFLQYYVSLQELHFKNIFQKLQGVPKSRYVFLLNETPRISFKLNVTKYLFYNGSIYLSLWFSI